MANRRKKTNTREKFLEALSLRGNVGDACAAADVSRSTVYAWREVEEDFAAKWETAVEQAIDRLESEAWRRAFEGADKAVTYQGEITATVKDYSDRLMECLLRAHRPEKYRERSQIELTGDADFAKLLMEARARRDET